MVLRHFLDPDAWDEGGLLLSGGGDFAVLLIMLPHTKSECRGDNREYGERQKATPGAAVISTGRMRVCPAEIAALRALIPANCCSRAKVTSRIEFAEATPTAMIAPIREGTLSVVLVM